MLLNPDSCALSPCSSYTSTTCEGSSPTTFFWTTKKSRNSPSRRSYFWCGHYRLAIALLETFSRRFFIWTLCTICKYSFSSLRPSYKLTSRLFKSTTHLLGFNNISFSSKHWRKTIKHPWYVDCYLRCMGEDHDQGIESENWRNRGKTHILSIQSDDIGPLTMIIAMSWCHNAFGFRKRTNQTTREDRMRARRFNATKKSSVDERRNVLGMGHRFWSSVGENLYLAGGWRRWQVEACSQRRNLRRRFLNRWKPSLQESPFPSSSPHLYHSK